MTLYQTAHDTQNERDVVARVERVTGLTMYELSDIRSAADWVAVRDGKVWGLVEIKCRTNTRQLYPTYMVDAAKVDKLKELSASLGIQGVVLVRFTDQICGINVATLEPLTKCAGGRRDRNDANDIDQVYHYDVRQLKQVCVL